jgi:hypothetical protein
MCKWLLLVGAYYLATACFIFLVPRFRDRRDDITSTLKDNGGGKDEGAGIIGFLMLLILSLSSFGLSWPIDFVNSSTPAGRRKIELWVLSLTLVDLLLLFLAIDHWHWLVFFPALTLLDSAYALIYFLIKWPPVQRPARSVLLDGVRYFQVIVAFAALFLVSCYFSGGTAFCNSGGGHVKLSAGQALYLSATTAATVGPGNMSPCLDGATGVVFPLRPVTLIPLEIFFVVLILAIEIPRITSSIKPKVPS